jgi:hypothetical protein
MDSRQPREWEGGGVGLDSARSRVGSDVRCTGTYLSSRRKWGRSIR